MLHLSMIRRETTALLSDLVEAPHELGGLVLVGQLEGKDVVDEGLDPLNQLKGGGKTHALYKLTAALVKLYQLRGGGGG